MVIKTRWTRELIAAWIAIMAGPGAGMLVIAFIMLLSPGSEPPLAIIAFGMLALLAAILWGTAATYRFLRRHWVVKQPDA